MSITDFIDADDPIVADLLAGTLELVVEAGGWFAPATTFVSRNGQFHVKSRAVEGTRLLHIPREAFVRVDEVIWGDNPDRLEILDVPEDFGDLGLELLYLQVALHNQTQKLSWMSKTHPWLAEDLPADVIEAVRELLPTFRIPAMTATDTLWANRCFRIALTPGQQPQRLLIPLVDLLNHHNSGATGSWTGDAFDVAAVTPFGTQECALNYGMNRDPLEMAAVYGFVDASNSGFADVQASHASQTKQELLANLVDTCALHPSVTACQILRDGAQLAMSTL